MFVRGAREPIAAHRVANSGSVVDVAVGWEVSIGAGVGISVDATRCILLQAFSRFTHITASFSKNSDTSPRDCL